MVVAAAAAVQVNTKPTKRGIVAAGNGVGNGRFAQKVGVEMFVPPKLRVDTIAIKSAHILPADEQMSAQA